MAEAAVNMLLGALGLYLVCGLLFAVPFVIRGVGRIDANAAGGSIGFRLLILPGSIALWPVLLARWRAGAGQPPEECSPHIRRSRRA